MKKKLLLAMMALAVSASAVPMAGIQANAAESKASVAAYDDDDDEEFDDDDDDVVTGGELTKYDIVVSPAKKTIKIGSSFYVNVTAADDSEWEDLPDEEWDEICEENIDNISFRSSKSSVASVSRTTGKVKGKKKGSAVIKTTVDLANGESVTFKTKVYVTR